MSLGALSGSHLSQPDFRAMPSVAGAGRCPRADSPASPGSLQSPHCPPCPSSRLGLWKGPPLLVPVRMPCEPCLKPLSPHPGGAWGRAVSPGGGRAVSRGGPGCVPGGSRAVSPGGGGRAVPRCGAGAVCRAAWQRVLRGQEAPAGRAARGHAHGRTRTRTGTRTRTHRLLEEKMRLENNACI